MKEKIIFIKETILSKRDYERYKLNDFIENGFNIEVLDLTLYNNPNYKEDVNVYSVSKELIFTPSGKKEILEYIKAIDHNSTIISLSRVNKKTFLFTRKFYRRVIKLDL